jgi:hypothetical protein
MDEQAIRDAAQRIGAIGMKMAQDIQDGIRQGFAEIADGIDSGITKIIEG